MPSDKLFRSLVRLPAVIFPGQAVSFTTRKTLAGPFALDPRVVTSAWRNHEGRVAVFGPGSRIGIELNFVYDDVLDSIEPTPLGVGHGMGLERVRLSRTVLGGVSDEHPLCEVVPLVDEVLTPAREERLADEAAAARELIERGQRTNSFYLEPSHHDEEIGGGEEVCDPRCHPLWPLQQEVPEDSRELSLWLASRLPLSTGLRIRLISNLCPLRRLQVRSRD